MFNDYTVVTGIRTIAEYASFDGMKESYGTEFPCNELIYFLDGEGIVHCGGKTARDREGSIRFHPVGKLPEGTGYDVETIKSGRCIDIYFDANPTWCDSFFTRDMSDNALLRRLFVNIERTWRTRQEGYYHKCMSSLYSILNEMSKSEKAYLSSEKYAKIKPAVDYIESRLPSGEIDYNALHQMCGISYSYFKRLFTAKFGSPPVKYITERRISYARDLLITGRYKVSEIAEMSGFDDLYYFSRVFKKVLGVSPKNYTVASPEYPAE